ncbi:MAG: polysaccharide biosynthesis/export family protein [Stenotrophobium sp.]
MLRNVLLTMVPGFFLAGCTILPGLNVKVPDQAPSDAPYTVVPITATVIESQQAGAADKASAANPVAALPAMRPDQHPDEYKIGPGDILSIIVWDHPELTNATGEFRDPVSSGRLVAADGTMFYPYVGVFSAAGKTVGELRQFLISKLSRVIQSPQVDIRVVAFRSQRVQVSGEVKTPGLVTIDDTSKGVIEAINERGGLTPEASRREVFLERGGHTYTVNMGGLLSGKGYAFNPLILPGDIISVPDASYDQVFVLGAVDKQSPMPIRQSGMSITEALAQAGGLDKLAANDSGVLVFRRPSGAAKDDNKATVFTLDMSRPAGMILAGEFQLQPRDVVYVKATDFAQYNAVINQLLPTVSAVFDATYLYKSTR